MLPKQPNQSLIDGLACLQALAGARTPVGVRELARQIGLEPTRVHRLVKTLAHLGLTRQTSDRRYGPGPGVHVLAAQAMFGSPLLPRALPVLATLQKRRLLVALGVRWRAQVAYLYHAEPGMRPEQALGRAGLFPATRSAIGMALLAQQAPTVWRELYARQDIPGYPRGLSSLRRALQKIRQDRFALVTIDPERGVRSLAVTLHEPMQAGLAFSGRFTDREIPELVEELRSAGQAMSEINTNPE